jgi:hypothetical protein
MSPDAKVQVVVKSRRVPIRTVRVSEPLFSTSGVYMGTRTNTRVIYDSTLDTNHRQAIEAGQRLSCYLGLNFEVIDSAKSGLGTRILSSLGLRA